jgi:ferric-dicitrate binding protein FerR (iron transport regulator)
MNEPTYPEPELQPADEQLVAYLDGELSAEERAEVERKLAEDEAYRERLEELDQTWEMLDTLPKADLDDEKFMRSTVEMITIAASQELESYRERKQLQGWIQYIAGTVLIIAAMVGGSRLVHRTMTSEDRWLINNLPVVENVDVYHRAKSVEFLDRLHREGLFTAEVPDDE